MFERIISVKTEKQKNGWKFFFITKHLNVLILMLRIIQNLQLLNEANCTGNWFYIPKHLLQAKFLNI